MPLPETLSGGAQSPLYIKVDFKPIPSEPNLNTQLALQPFYFVPQWISKLGFVPHEYDTATVLALQHMGRRPKLDGSEQDTQDALGCAIIDRSVELWSLQAVRTLATAMNVFVASVRNIDQLHSHGLHAGENVGKVSQFVM